MEDALNFTSYFCKSTVFYFWQRSGDDLLLFGFSTDKRGTQIETEPRCWSMGYFAGSLVCISKISKCWVRCWFKEKAYCRRVFQVEDDAQSCIEMCHY